MGILLGFVPFVAFALLERFVGAPVALSVGALIAIALEIRSWLSPQRHLSVLGIGTALLFAGLAVYSALARDTLSPTIVRLCVNGGLLLIVLFSLAIRRPFTLAYAREQVDPAHWNSPRFLRTNYIISAVWALAFAVIVAVEVATLILPTLPPNLSFNANILAIVAAAFFTNKYAKSARQATPA